MDDFDRGFVIGLLVGGGSFTADREQPALSIKLNARDPEPLRRLEMLLGGKVFGPYNHGGRHYYVWHLRGSQLRAAIPLFRDNLPPCWKRAQFEQWLDKHAEALGHGGSPVDTAVAE
ncbi:MAG: hypothetical protein IRY91_08795 [Gemmatimonadaceae bacterium]|nr:hypothetical protein [Gemmatimonadaceae bacterium]